MNFVNQIGAAIRFCTRAACEYGASRRAIGREPKIPQSEGGSAIDA
jgi:hypothetical protein